MFVRTIRVNPKSITPEMGYLPLEQLGEVSVEEIEFEKIRIKPFNNRETKPKRPTIANLRSAAWKEACIQLIQEHQPCTARQIWEGLCNEHDIRLVTVQMFLKGLVNSKELGLTQRREWIKGRHCRVNYYHIQEIIKKDAIA